METYSNPRRAQELRVGLLVLCGFAATIALIIFSDGISFETSYRITAFLDNAGGLRKGSPVELSGIKIGEIERIQTSKSYQSKGAVVAVLTINSTYTLYSSSELTIGTKGIFGDSFLSITAPGDPLGDELPKNGTGDMVATRGFLGEMSTKGQYILDALADVLNEDTRGDIKRFIKEGADTVAMSKVLITQLQDSTIRLHKVLDNVDKVSAGIHLSIANVGTQSQEVLQSMNQTVLNVRLMLQGLDKEFVGIAKNLQSSLLSFDKLAQSTQRIMGSSEGDIVAALKSIRLIGNDLQVVAQDLRQGKGVLGRLTRSAELARDVDNIAISIQSISERISEHPEILLFGESNEARNKARLQRKRNQQRRAFNEGYGSVLGTRAPGIEDDDTPARRAAKESTRPIVGEAE